MKLQDRALLNEVIEAERVGACSAHAAFHFIIDHRFWTAPPRHRKMQHVKKASRVRTFTVPPRRGRTLRG